MRHRVFDNETHPNWCEVSNGVYYGNTERGAGVRRWDREDDVRLVCWDGPGFLVNQLVSELQAVVLLASDPEELMRHYSGRGPE